MVQNVAQLYSLLLNILDLKISSNTSIIYTEDGSYYMPSGRRLRYNPNGSTLIHMNELRFDPLKNSRQMEDLFMVFLQYQEEDDELSVEIYYGVKLKDGRTLIELKTSEGILRSDPFYNISLGYMDMIFKMSGFMIPNLRDFDIDPTVEVKKRRMRRKPIFPRQDEII